MLKHPGAMPFLLFIFIIIFPASVFGMNVELSVIDGDLEMPLEGAVVSLRDGRQYICNNWGKATFSLLDGTQAIIQISYPGYDTRRITITAVEKSAPERISVALQLSGIMQGRELVIEAPRIDTSETKSGRSVAIAERELARTAEIGIVEDVMSSVKLLPGVGYSGMFSAMPSIRGGDPGDLMASLDGFYLDMPYHWMGGVSIFDPKMITSAQLSHGVFSSRYGHTISGLLEVASKSPSPTETELEVGLSSSSASINLSYPFSGKGGFLFTGKVTYWDTLVWAAQGLSKVIDNDTLQMINAVSTSPYIRSLAMASNYWIKPNLEWRINAFFGADGVGADYNTEYDGDDGIKGEMDLAADYNNYQGFIITGLNASPVPSLALRFTLGAGIMETITEDAVESNVTVFYKEDFLTKFSKLKSFPFSLDTTKSYKAPNMNAAIEMESTAVTAQARMDADWDLGKGFIAAFGVQELYSLWLRKGDIGLNFIEIAVKHIPADMKASMPGWDALIALLGDEVVSKLEIVMPKEFKLNTRNQGLTSSAYALLEYMSPGQRIGAELGLRVDHLLFIGKDFTIATKPSFNPRFNIDFSLIKNKGKIDSLGLALGTGLFTSMDKLFSFFDPSLFSMGEDINIDVSNLEVDFNRSWTSVIGLKLDLAKSYSISLEGYYKNILNRVYITADILSGGTIIPQFNFNGKGTVWGFDVQLQKLESRYFDGWISYSFNWVKYYNPDNKDQVDIGGDDNLTEKWFWPSFHRFHNCNVVMNIKPFRWFSIGTRVGFASGQPQNKIVGEIESYPVIVLDKDNKPLMSGSKPIDTPLIIQKYGRKTEYDDDTRSPWLLPIDIKFSFYRFDKKGRVNTEIYLAVENLSSLFYTPVNRTSFNDYTGKEDTGGGAGFSNFDLPIPMISFGFKWRY